MAKGDEYNDVDDSDPDTQEPSPGPGLRASPPFLFSALLLLCIATGNMQNFFAYHAPGAVADELQRHYHLSTSQFGLLFTLYSLPNIGLVFVGGLAIDRYGPAYTSLLFNGLMLLGTLIIAMAPADAPLPYFIVGRLLLGFGESLCAAMATALGQWFKGSVLTFAVGFNQAYVQLFGSAAAFYVLPLLHDVELAMWVTAAVCVLSFVANIAYVVLQSSCAHYKPDYEELQQSAEDEDEAEHRQQDATAAAHELLTGTASSFDSLQYQQDGSGSDGRWKLQGAAHNVDEDEVVHYHGSDDQLPSSSSSVSSTLSSLSVLYWLVILMILLLSPILYTYTAFGPLEFQSKFGLDAAAAGSATSVLYATIILSPLAGYVIDTVGYRTLIQFVAAGFIPVWFALMTFTSCSPVVGMTLLGLTFAVTESNGYAMIVEVVPQHQLGVAYGIAGCAVSLALLLEPATVGFLKQQTGSFLLSDLLFIALATLGWAVSGAILAWDLAHDSVMSGRKLRPGTGLEPGEDEDQEAEGRWTVHRTVVTSEGLGNSIATHRTGAGALDYGPGSVRYDDI